MPVSNERILELFDLHADYRTPIHQTVICVFREALTETDALHKKELEKANKGLDLAAQREVGLNRQFNKVMDENKRLRDALEKINMRCTNLGVACEIAKQALSGEQEQEEACKKCWWQEGGRCYFGEPERDSNGLSQVEALNLCENFKVKKGYVASFFTEWQKQEQDDHA